jgi:hypothetical protein
MVLGVVLGLVVGLGLGVLAGPWIRSWIAWREYVEASREARLHEEILRLMSTAADEERSRPTVGG